MKKGFALDDDWLKNLGGGNYFVELLAHINWSSGQILRKYPLSAKRADNGYFYCSQFFLFNYVWLFHMLLSSSLQGLAGLSGKTRI